ncbi:MAG: histidine kinase, partial [Bacillota bacterium]|nr:histidine kinase [Bacillota bacterium]
NAFKHVCHINESDSLGVFAQALIKVTDDNYDTQKILKGMLSKNEKRISGHIHIRTTRDIWYSVIAQQVLNSKGKMIGRLISFNDITTIHKLSEELTDKSEKLENMNKGLKAANEEILKHTLTIEELAVTRERNRILSELHDSVGQAYTSNLALARHAETILDNQQEEALKALDEMTYITKDLLNTITYSLNNIKDKIIDRQPLEAALEVLFNAYRNSGLKIDFYSDIKNTGIKYNVRHCIYRICQESITNSLKHGMANVIKVIIETKNGRLLLNITDDGLGCNSIRKGIGLKGIENRALELNGNVDFEPSSQGGGFSVHVEIPLEKEPIV